MRGERDTFAFILGLALVVAGVGFYSVPLAIILTGLFIAGSTALVAYLRALGKRDR